MVEHRKFAFDIGVTFIASLVSMILGFAISILLGRDLGAEDLGLFRMASTIYGFSILISAFGIPASMIKYVAEFKDDKYRFNQVMSAGIAISMLAGILSSVIFYFTSSIFSELFKMPGLSNLLKLFSILFLFTLTEGILLGLLNGLRQMKKYAAATLIQSVSMVTITVVSIYLGFGVLGAVIGFVSSHVICCAFLILICRGYFDITFEGFMGTIRKLLDFGAKLFAADAINEINNQLAIVMIGFFLLPSDVGYYSVAASLSIFFWLIPMAVQRTTYPATSSYWRDNDYTSINKMMDKTIKYCTIILLSIGLGTFFFSKTIIVALFKESFVYAVLPLQILLIGTVIRGSIAQPIGGSLTGIGRPDAAMKISVLMMAINIILNLILIPRFGTMGAATATTVSLSGGAFIQLYLIIKYINIKFDTVWHLKVTLVAITSVLLFRLGANFLDPILLGGALMICYLVLIIKFFVTEEDISIIKSILTPIHKSLI